MTKKRIKHELIRNESKRNTTLQKRTDGLLKKADELSVLCGVDVAVILHKRRQIGVSYSEDDNNHDNAVLWPSSSMFRERLHRFLDLTNFEMRRRMINHEKYMEQRTNEEAQSSSKLKKTIELLESRQLMRQILLESTNYNNNLQELDLTELNGLNSVVDDMLTKLEIKEYDDELNNDDQLNELMAPPPPPPPLPPRQEMGGGGGRGASSSSSASEFEAAGMVAPTSSQPVLVPAADELENMKNEQWFIHAMSGNQDQLFEPPQPTDAGGGASTSAGGVNVPPSPDGESPREYP